MNTRSLFLAPITRSMIAAGAVALLAPLVVAADSNPQNPPTMPTVSGTVHFGSQKAKMTHLYSRRKKTDEGEMLALLFSSHPLPERVLDDRQKLQQLSRKEAFLGLYAEIDASGMQQSEVLYNEGTFSGSWRFEAPEGKETTTAGRIGMDEEREFFGKPYKVDVSFKLAGKVNGAWGGSPFFQTPRTGLALGRAEGTMERRGKKTDFSQAIALKETGLFGESGERSVLLTTKPVTEDMFKGSRGPEQALQQAGIAYLRVTFDDKGEVQTIMAPTEEGSTSFSSNQWDLVLVSSAGAEIEGYLETVSAPDPDSEYPHFKFKFHAPMRKIGPAEPVTEKNGKPLPKDGGEPGKAYVNFAKALANAKTIEELLPLRITAMGEQLNSVPPGERSAVLGFLKGQAKTPFNVVGGFGNDQQATLWVAGKEYGETVAGRINVHREDGVWKLGAESFRVGKLAEK